MVYFLDTFTVMCYIEREVIYFNFGSYAHLVVLDDSKFCSH